MAHSLYTQHMKIFIHHNKKWFIPYKSQSLPVAGLVQYNGNTNRNVANNNFETY